VSTLARERGDLLGQYLSAGGRNRLCRIELDRQLDTLTAGGKIQTIGFGGDFRSAGPLSLFASLFIARLKIKVCDFDTYGTWTLDENVRLIGVTDFSRR
jgi:hypothetical protein